MLKKLKNEKSNLLYTVFSFFVRLQQKIPRIKPCKDGLFF